MSLGGCGVSIRGVKIVRVANMLLLGKLRFNFQGATDLAVGNPRRGSETTPSVRSTGNWWNGTLVVWVGEVCFVRQSLKG